MSQVAVGPLVRDVGTGYGEPGTVAVLRDGQLTKRLIMLRTLLTEATARCPDEAQAAGLSAAFTYLINAQRSHPDDVQSLLMYPNLGSWLSFSLRRVVAGGDAGDPIWPDLGYLGWIAASSMISVGQPGTMRVVVRHGEVMLPRFGLARLDPADRSGHAELRWTGSALQFSHGEQTLEVTSVDSDADPRWLPMRRLTAPEPEPVSLYLDDLDPFRDLSDPYSTRQITAPPPRLSAAQAGVWSQQFATAWQVLAEGFPSYLPPMRSGLRAVIPLTADPLIMGASNTSFDAFGCINMSAPGGPHQFALTLIHEFQHAKLAALTDQVQLHQPDPTKRFYAPWRDDPRPLSGLLQGIYAHLGVTDFWRIHRGSRDGDSTLAHVEFARWRGQVRRALAEAGGSGLLTADGEAFVQAMAATLRPWLDEPVPAVADHIAREAATAHRVVWCVRNLRCGPADIADLYARQRNRPAGPPVLPGSSLVRQDLIPADHRSRLLPSYVKLIGLGHTAGPDQPEHPAADLAFAAGDHHRAYTLYAAEISATPTHPQPWAGLALTLPHSHPGTRIGALLRRGEVVAQLYQAIAAAGENCDLIELVDWLSDGADDE